MNFTKLAIEARKERVSIAGMCLIYLSTEVDEVGVSHGRGRVWAGTQAGIY